MVKRRPRTRREDGAEASPGIAGERRGDSRTRILAAAFRRLAQDGYAAFRTREVARDAGVNHALIHYHFRTKDQLLIAVLDEANRRLLERQERMYGSPGGFAGKWQEARRFYDADLASGFVRVQAELWAASISSPELREKFRPRIQAWKKVVLGGVREALAVARRGGLHLPPFLSAEAIAWWISEFWLGMEFADLLQAEEDRGPHRQALDAMQRLLERLDALAGGMELEAAPRSRRRGGQGRGAKVPRRKR
jgi:AcrR family transcriptional regulator